MKTFRGCSQLFIALLVSAGGLAWAQPSFVELSWIAAGDGLMIYGQGWRHNLGDASAAGDLNGDGYADLALAASGADTSDRGARVGEIYVLFGPLPRSGTIDLATLDREDGFVLPGLEAEGRASVSGKSGRCDVNADGIHDLLGVASNETPGRTFVLFGAREFPPDLDLELDGDDGFLIRGINGQAAIIACAGDVNGDGFDDVLVGAPYGGPGFVPPGEAYLVLGGRHFPPVVELAELTPETGVVVTGDSPNDHFGGAVSGAGDVDGDGLDDVLIGADEANHNGKQVGEAYLIYGRTEFDINPDNRHERYQTVLRGSKSIERAGTSVAAAGDVNADGYPDLLVGSSGKDVDELRDAGVTYVIFGGPDLPKGRRLRTVNGDDGFAILGGHDHDTLGARVAGVGDVDGDGIDDLATTATGGSPWGKRNAGQTYIVFGRPRFPQSLVSASFDGTDGYVLNGEQAEDNAGRLLSAGDLDGDGRNDLVIGATRVDRDGVEDVGAVYVIFEQAAPTPAWVVFPPQPSGGRP